MSLLTGWDNPGDRHDRQGDTTDMDDDFDIMLDEDFREPRICAAPETSANISSKTGRDEMELVMSVYNVSEVEAWKILKAKAKRRKMRAERQRKAMEKHAGMETLE